MVGAALFSFQRQTTSPSSMALPISAPAPASMIVPSRSTAPPRDRRRGGHTVNSIRRRRPAGPSNYCPRSASPAETMASSSASRSASRRRNLTMQARSTVRPSSSVVVMKAAPSRCTRSATAAIEDVDVLRPSGRYLKQSMLSGPAETSSKSGRAIDARAQRAWHERCHARSGGGTPSTPTCCSTIHSFSARKPRVCCTVNSLNHGIAASSRKIRRHEAEGVTHRLRVADDCAAAFHRDVEPLVRIDAEAVGAIDPGEMRDAPPRRAPRRRRTRHRRAATDPRWRRRRQCRSSGSMAPVLTVPALATTATGR